ncbi:NAD-dependent 15-hydroxyprostaglandin dehydrogenase (short-chain dehydrogenase) [Verticillium dahliae]
MGYTVALRMWIADRILRNSHKSQRRPQTSNDLLGPLKSGQQPTALSYFSSPKPHRFEKSTHSPSPKLTIMALSVAGKYAVITGAGSGINLAFAKQLLERGCSVLIGDLALRPEAEALLAQYPKGRDGGGGGGGSGQPHALFQATNVASWPQLTRLWQRALEAFPQVDIVCPGAGLFEPTRSAFWHPPRTATNPDSPSTDAADADPGTYAVLDVNLTHPIRLSQLAVGHWTQARRPGCLVHVSSIAGHAVGLGSPLYFASKHGLHAFVRSLGSLREHLGIRVGAVAPGAVMTPMWLEDPDKRAILDADAGAADIFIHPDEIARGMMALCEDPAYGDGTILEVTKGSTRVVPLYHAEPPSGVGSMVPGYQKAADELVTYVKGGVKV